MLALTLLLLLLAVLLPQGAVATYSLGIRDSVMIAHSFDGAEFGPAQALHGATYTVDVDFSAEDLEPKVNWVVDIGAASDLLAEVLKRYNFKHLNDIFPTENTTTEFMCRAIHNDIASLVKAKCWKVSHLRVKLHESHKAWAEYSAPLLLHDDQKSVV